MRLWSVFSRSMREQLRSPWLLLLTLIIAPFFVFFDWIWLGGGGSTSYALLVLNQDQGEVLADGSLFQGGEAVMEALQEMTYSDGQSVLQIKEAVDRDEAESRLKDREAAALLVLPPDFSLELLAPGEPTSVLLVGDLTNPQYTVAAVLAGAALEEYVVQATGEPRPLLFREEALGGSGVRTEFELYVPAFMILAVIMMIFQTAMTVAREVESGTLQRLLLTRMTAFDYLVGVSLTQVVIGVAAVLLTFLTALALGFRSQGPLWVAVLAGAITGISIVGVGLLVACLSRTVSEAFVYANFPLMLLMFFTGAVYPVPPLNLFTLGGHTFNLYELLPPTHGVAALNKVLTLGVGLDEVAYELTALLLLSLVYFAAGIWLFGRTHLRPKR